MTSIAAAVASRACLSFAIGVAIDPEQSTMMISAAPAAADGPDPGREHVAFRMRLQHWLSQDQGKGQAKG